MSKPRHRSRSPFGLLSLAAALATAFPAAAQEDLQTVVVTARGTEMRLLDTPYAIGVLTAEDLRAAGPQINLSEALARIPGVIASNRNNYAQDLQINSRGFGARASFGVRGLRLYSDGKIGRAHV